eukprot:2937607-Pleurochrysis_carterae.AAC.1
MSSSLSLGACGPLLLRPPTPNGCSALRQALLPRSALRSDDKCVRLPRDHLGLILDVKSPLRSVQHAAAS